jgi:hypothetical protein
MPNLFAVHVILDYEGHMHLSIHDGYEAAMNAARDLASSPEYDREVYTTWVKRVTLGEDITNLDNAEEIVDAT